MTLKKLMSMLVMLAITTFVFTACEDDPTDPTEPGTTITPAAVANVYVGQTGAKQITVEWNKSASQDSTWFHGYQVKVTGGSAAVDTIITTHGGASTAYHFGAADPSIIYTFTISTLGKTTGTSGDSIVASPAKTITWATATHFTKNDVNADIKVYVKASSIGSGLSIYDADNSAPATYTVANRTKWNLGLGSSTELIFGSASSVIDKMSYGGTGTPTSADITVPLDFDFAAGLTPEQMLSNTLLGEDLSKLTFNNSYIDLNTNSIAKANSNGIVFFARLNNHYAKIIVIKKNGSYLQGTGNDQYIQVLVSYQTAAGIPYAKIFGKQ